MKRAVIGIYLLALLAACSLPATLDGPPVSMGNFRLGHNVVIVDAPEQGPFSRQASDEELKVALETAIQDRLGPYEGDKFYNIGVKLDLYALALPGIPIVFTLQSAFVVSVTLWDDASQTLLSEEGGKGLTVFEGASAEALISSGLLQNKDRQMEILAANTAKAIQDWILDNPEWVGLAVLPEPATPAN